MKYCRICNSDLLRDSIHSALRIKYSVICKNARSARWPESNPRKRRWREIEWEKRCVSLRPRPIICTTGCIRGITLPSFCPVENMQVCVCIVYARETLRVIPNERIVSAPRGYCPIRDSSSADDRTGSVRALLKATRARRYVFVVYRFDVYDPS